MSKKKFDKRFGVLIPQIHVDFIIETSLIEKDTDFLKKLKTVASWSYFASETTNSTVSGEKDFNEKTPISEQTDLYGWERILCRIDAILEKWIRFNPVGLVLVPLRRTDQKYAEWLVSYEKELEEALKNLPFESENLFKVPAKDDQCEMKLESDLPGTKYFKYQVDVTYENGFIQVQTCLKFLCLLLKNSRNKIMIHSKESILQHCMELLSARDESLEELALKIFAAVHDSFKPTSHPDAEFEDMYRTSISSSLSLSKLLLGFAQGYGNKSQGLDLTSVLTSEQSELPKFPGTVKYDYYLEKKIGEKLPEASGSKRREFAESFCIELSSEQLGAAESGEIFEKCLNEYPVPEKHLFGLLQRIRLARSFLTKAGRRRRVKNRLRSLAVLIRIYGSSNIMSAYFQHEVQITQEICALIASPSLYDIPPNEAGSEIPLDIQIKALKVLHRLPGRLDEGGVGGSLSLIARQSGILQLLGVVKGCHNGMLLNLVQETLRIISTDMFAHRRTVNPLFEPAAATVEDEMEDEAESALLSENEDYFLFDPSETESVEFALGMSFAYETSRNVTQSKRKRENTLDEDHLEVDANSLDSQMEISDQASVSQGSLSAKHPFLSKQKIFKWVENLLILCFEVTGTHHGAALLSTAGLLNKLYLVVREEITSRRENFNFLKYYNRSKNSERRAEVYYDSSRNRSVTLIIKIIENLVYYSSLAVSIAHELKLMLSCVLLLEEVLLGPVEKALFESNILNDGFVSDDDANEYIPTKISMEKKESREEEIHNKKKSILNPRAMKVLDLDDLQKEKSRLLPIINSSTRIDPNTLDISQRLIVRACLHFLVAFVQRCESDSRINLGMREKYSKALNALHLLFKTPKLLSPGTFSILAVLFCEVINQDPSAINAVYEANVHDTIYRLIGKREVPWDPYCIALLPGLVNVLCLHSTGETAVKNCGVLKELVGYLFHESLVLNANVQVFNLEHNESQKAYRIAAQNLDFFLRHHTNFRKVAFRHLLQNIQYLMEAKYSKPGLLFQTSSNPIKTNIKPVSNQVDIQNVALGSSTSVVPTTFIEQVSNYPLSLDGWINCKDALDSRRLQITRNFLPLLQAVLEHKTAADVFSDVKGITNTLSLFLVLTPRSLEYLIRNGAEFDRYKGVDMLRTVLKHLFVSNIYGCEVLEKLLKSVGAFGDYKKKCHEELRRKEGEKLEVENSVDIVSLPILAALSEEVDLKDVWTAVAVNKNQNKEKVYPATRSFKKTLIKGLARQWKCLAFTEWQVRLLTEWLYNSPKLQTGKIGLLACIAKDSEKKFHTLLKIIIQVEEELHGCVGLMTRESIRLDRLRKASRASREIFLEKKLKHQLSEELLRFFLAGRDFLVSLAKCIQTVSSKDIEFISSYYQVLENSIFPFLENSFRFLDQNLPEEQWFQRAGLALEKASCFFVGHGSRDSKTNVPFIHLFLRYRRDLFYRVMATAGEALLRTMQFSQNDLAPRSGEPKSTAFSRTKQEVVASACDILHSIALPRSMLYAFFLRNNAIFQGILQFEFRKVNEVIENDLTKVRTNHLGIFSPDDMIFQLHSVLLHNIRPVIEHEKFSHLASVLPEECQRKFFKTVNQILKRPVDFCPERHVLKVFQECLPSAALRKDQDVSVILYKRLQQSITSKKQASVAREPKEESDEEDILHTEGSIEPSAFKSSSESKALNLVKQEVQSFRNSRRKTMHQFVESLQSCLLAYLSEDDFATDDVLVLQRQKTFAQGLALLSCMLLKSPGKNKTKNFFNQLLKLESFSQEDSLSCGCFRQKLYFSVIGEIQIFHRYITEEVVLKMCRNVVRSLEEVDVSLPLLSVDCLFLVSWSGFLKEDQQKGIFSPELISLLCSIMKRLNARSCSEGENAKLEFFKLNLHSVLILIECALLRDSACKKFLKVGGLKELLHISGKLSFEELPVLGSFIMMRLLSNKETMKNLIVQTLMHRFQQESQKSGGKNKNRASLEAFLPVLAHLNDFNSTLFLETFGSLFKVEKSNTERQGRSYFSRFARAQSFLLLSTEAKAILQQCTDSRASMLSRHEKNWKQVLQVVATSLFEQALQGQYFENTLRMDLKTTVEEKPSNRVEPSLGLVKLLDMLNVLVFILPYLNAILCKVKIHSLRKNAVNKIYLHLFGLKFKRRNSEEKKVSYDFLALLVRVLYPLASVSQKIESSGKSLSTGKKLSKDDFHEKFRNSLKSFIEGMTKSSKPEVYQQLFQEAAEYLRDLVKASRKTVSSEHTHLGDEHFRTNRMWALDSQVELLSSYSAADLSHKRFTGAEEKSVVYELLFKENAVQNIIHALECAEKSHPSVFQYVSNILFLLSDLTSSQNLKLLKPDVTSWGLRVKSASSYEKKDDTDGLGPTSGSVNEYTQTMAINELDDERDEESLGSTTDEEEEEFEHYLDDEEENDETENEEEDEEDIMSHSGLEGLPEEGTVPAEEDSSTENELVDAYEEDFHDLELGSQAEDGVTEDEAHLIDSEEDEVAGLESDDEAHQNTLNPMGQGNPLHLSSPAEIIGDETTANTLQVSDVAAGSSLDVNDSLPLARDVGSSGAQVRNLEQSAQGTGTNLDNFGFSRDFTVLPEASVPGRSTTFTRRALTRLDRHHLPDTLTSRQEEDGSAAIDPRNLFFAPSYLDNPSSFNLRSLLRSGGNRSPLPRAGQRGEFAQLSRAIMTFFTGPQERASSFDSFEHRPRFGFEPYGADNASETEQAADLSDSLDNEMIVLSTAFQGFLATVSNESQDNYSPGLTLPGYPNETAKNGSTKSLSPKDIKTQAGNSNDMLSMGSFAKVHPLLRNCLTAEDYASNRLKCLLRTLLDRFAHENVRPTQKKQGEQKGSSNLENTVLSPNPSEENVLMRGHDSRSSLGYPRHHRPAFQLPSRITSGTLLSRLMDEVSPSGRATTDHQAAEILRSLRDFDNGRVGSEQGEANASSNSEGNLGRETTPNTTSNQEASGRGNNLIIPNLFSDVVATNTEAANNSGVNEGDSPMVDNPEDSSPVEENDADTNRPAGVDLDVWNSLTPELRREIMSNTEATGLPQRGTTEVATQAEAETTTRVATPSTHTVLETADTVTGAQATAGDNTTARETEELVTFIDSLTSLEIRNEVFMELTSSQVSALPTRLRLEALRVRRPNRRAVAAFDRSNLPLPFPRLRTSSSPTRRPVAADEVKPKGIQLEKNIEGFDSLVSERDIETLLSLLFYVRQGKKNHYRTLLMNLCKHERFREIIVFKVLQLLTPDDKVVHLSVSLRKTNARNSQSKSIRPFFQGFFEVHSKKSVMFNDRKWIPKTVYGTSEMVFTLYSSELEAVEGFLPYLATRRLLDNLKYLCTNHRRTGLLLLQREGVLELLCELIGIKQYYQNPKTLVGLVEVVSVVVSPLFDIKNLRDTRDPHNEVDLVAGSSIQAATQTALDNSAASSPRTKKRKIEEIEIPKRVLGKKYIIVLIEVILKGNCSEEVFTKIKIILLNLAKVKENRKQLVHVMSAHVNILFEELNKLLNAVLPNSGPTSNDVELNLYRFLKVLKELSDAEGLKTLEPGLANLTFDLGGFCDELIHAIKTEAKGKLIDSSMIIGKLLDSFAGKSHVRNHLAHGDEKGPKALNKVIKKNIRNKMDKSYVRALSVGFAQAKLTILKSFSLYCTLFPSERNEGLFHEFVVKFRNILNSLIHQTPNLLENEFGILLSTPKYKTLIDFENKRLYFKNRLRQLRSTKRTTLRLRVRRSHVFEDSFIALGSKKKKELLGKVTIQFENEEGIDAGGVTREFYQILCRQMFKPDYGFFKASSDGTSFQPDSRSAVLYPDHIRYFRFIGRVVSKALFDGVLLDAHFTRSFYKHILGLPIDYRDIQSIDPQYYKSLCDLLTMNLDDLGLDLSFTADEEELGVVKTVELKPNGKNIAVTDENKMEYIQLCTKHKMTTGIKPQIDAFLEGFHDLVPRKFISIFDEQELELLIAGVPEVDIDDLQKNTDYVGYSSTSTQVVWFWKVLKSMSKEDHAKFLMFVTGTSKVPLDGFKSLVGMRGHQKFSIHKAGKNNNILPSAHTCFNQLDLPEYQDEKILKEKLRYAIHEGAEGFGFG
eukprot:augustus_masked-scaffold_18-processed-gene-5.6-mRNA-1 protein AED:0.45 eAED:0.45 QI:0/-1/0/1/-1/1/1/0/4073